VSREDHSSYYARNNARMKGQYTEEDEKEFLKDLPPFALRGYLVAMRTGEHRTWSPAQVEKFCRIAERRLSK